MPPQHPCPLFILRAGGCKEIRGASVKVLDRAGETTKDFVLLRKRTLYHNRLARVLLIQ